MSGRSLAAGILAAIIALVVVLGGVSLSLAEAQTTPIKAPPTSTPAFPATEIVLINPTITSQPANTSTPLPSPSATRTLAPSPTRTYTRTPLPTSTFTPTPAQSSTYAPCAQPAGWTVYIVVPGDYLSQIAYIYGITLADLRRVNCLGRSSIIHPGDKLYVPALPTPTLNQN